MASKKELDCKQANDDIAKGIKSAIQKLSSFRNPDEGQSGDDKIAMETLDRIKKMQLPYLESEHLQKMTLLEFLRELLEILDGTRGSFMENES